MESRIRFDWRDLELFVAVAETGSIARAAERSHTVASAVSKRLADLERELATPLLERHSKGVGLTAAGEALLGRARSLIEQARQVEQEVRGYGAGLSGLVRLHANISAIVEFLPAALASFGREHPGIRVHLEEHVSDAIARAVVEQVADLGIVSDQPQRDGLELVPFRTDRLQLLVTPDHPLAGRGKVRFAESLDYPLVGLPATSALHARLQREAAEAGRELHLPIRVSSFDAVCAMVAAGLGVGVVPQAATTPYIASLGLMALTLDEDWALRQLFVCRRAGEALSPAAQRLFTHLCRA